MSERHFGAITVETSNEDKLLFPADGITKGDLMDYYEAISDRLLPFLRDRPLVMQRFPDGVGAAGFYQKQVAEHFPEWISTVRVARSQGGPQELVVCDKKATLVYLANLACIALHPWLSRTDRLDRPDQLVIDLDPPPDADFTVVREAARACRALFDELDLPTFVKTTGSHGLHVVVPLDRSTDFESVREFAHDAMALLADRLPDRLTTEVRKAKRAGRVFLDVARNAYAQTAVAPYSVRPRPGAPVATPVAWRELSSVQAQSYRVANLFRRLAQRDDPWAGWRRRARSLDAAHRRLAKLRAGTSD